MNITSSPYKIMLIQKYEMKATKTAKMQLKTTRDASEKKQLRVKHKADPKPKK